MSTDDTDPVSPDAPEELEDRERRSFMQGMVLGGLVLSHSTGGNDGGWFSDWFGGSDDGASPPGFFTDVQYRHEDEVVIDDPEIVDFVGDALDVERPNHYDEGIRIKVDGDVAVAGEDIAPKSVTTESVDTEDATIDQLTFDHSQNYPQYPNQPARSAAPSLKPYPGVDNPILGPEDVSGYNAEFVADPFWVYDQDAGKVRIVAEAMNRTNGDSAFVTESSDDILSFDTLSVIEGPRDNSNGTLNYPYTFQHDGTWYILDFKSGGIRLLETDFTESGTTTVADPWVDPQHQGDPNLIRWNGTWYFINSGGSNGKFVYYFDDFDNPSLTAHPDNPILDDANDLLNSNAGRPIVDRDGILVPCRGGTPERVSMIRLTELTKTSSAWHEVETSPVLQPEFTKWNNIGMHHMDMLLADKYGTDAVLVDGQGGANSDWAIGIYTVESGADPRFSQRFDGYDEALIFEPQFESLDGWQVSTTGGTVSLDQRYVELQTTTSGDKTMIRKGLLSGPAFTRASFDADSYYRIGIQLQDSATDREEYHCVGSIGTSGDAGYGFKILDGTLYGVVHDGTSETTTQLGSVGSGSRRRLMADYKAGEYVQFFVGAPSLTREGTISTGLPTGTTDYIAESYLGITASVTRTTWVTPPRYQQSPHTD